MTLEQVWALRHPRAVLESDPYMGEICFIRGTGNLSRWADIKHSSTNSSGAATVSPRKQWPRCICEGHRNLSTCHLEERPPR